MEKMYIIYCGDGSRHVALNYYNPTGAVAPDIVNVKLSKDVEIVEIADGAKAFRRDGVIYLDGEYGNDGKNVFCTIDSRGAVASLAVVDDELAYRL